MRFAHVGITVADRERSRRFYESYFGFDPSYRVEIFWEALADPPPPASR
jgi:catechol 2,3-dioxygenase-like lactoylglutathione lyase family enzyme